MQLTTFSRFILLNVSKSTGFRSVTSIYSHSATTTTIESRRDASSSSVQKQGGLSAPFPPPPSPPPKWDLYVGVVLERKPIITQELTPLEKEYAQLLSKYEFELSKKSNHEIRKEKDIVIIEKIKSGEIDPDQASAITAQDEEDLWLAELNQFKIASRKTDADKRTDQKSLQRALDSHLLLVIQQKLGKDYKWMCPQSMWRNGETLRQTAERILMEVCPEIKAKVLGNAPWGLYKYKYPKRSIADQHLSSVGAKVFFYKTQLLSGEITLKMKDKSKSKSKEDSSSSTEYNDYVWLTREELISKLQPEYHKQISEFLIDEAN